MSALVTVLLTRDRLAVLDHCDADLAQKRWCATPGRRKRWYACRKEGGRLQYMHRVVLERILGRPLGKMEVSDHINGDGLDNRRRNLRACSNSENLHNHGLFRTNTSGINGVSWDKNRKRWRVSVTIRGKTIYLGQARNIADAKLLLEGRPQ